MRLFRECEWFLYIYCKIVAGVFRPLVVSHLKVSIPRNEWAMDVCVYAFKLFHFQERKLVARYPVRIPLSVEDINHYSKLTWEKQ